MLLDPNSCLIAKQLLDDVLYLFSHISRVRSLWKMSSSQNGERQNRVEELILLVQTTPSHDPVGRQTAAAPISR